MPELPEVESVRRQLAPELVGRCVVGVWRDAYPAARLGALHDLVGRRITSVLRRGKFLTCGLDQPAARPPLELVLHLGMSGSLSFEAADGAIGSGRAGHVRVRLHLDDGRTLRFNDPRRFGRATVVPAGDYAGRVPTLATMGPEPLSTGFTSEVLAEALARSRAPVKARLLDQRVVAGIGNIYADEALWRARIHPGARRVGSQRAARLRTALVAVLSEAIEREGTTFRDYQLVNGASGRQVAFLDAYGRAGLPCRRCGSPLRRSVVAGRGTTACPNCQRS